ncbi:RecX family transcriptional regulator [Pedobacter sp. HMF7647]|uniref:Regulatory protein RecX n=1 Tax=Hufsiella arboris TaxID=2695275 RepID=A0A7K1YE21_9SPHI|nr:regulatory protein RecX [Hufsiella arboris]MXV52299.1 RecX family transcriptional regulator [Hufsiella arboris]
MESPKKVITKNEAVSKIESYCAYQERSQKEVRYKLIDLGIYGEDLETIISDLIQQNFLNEERFAKAYALGKFRMKQWGKIKIRQGLKLKGVPEKLIQKALKQIDDDDYYQTLATLLDKKTLQTVAKNPIQNRYKLSQYATAKGYERDLIFEILRDKEL